MTFNEEPDALVTMCKQVTCLIELYSMDNILFTYVNYICSFIFFGSLFQTTVFSLNADVRPAIKLEDVIMRDYDSFQTPRIRGKPADVSIQIEILNIRSVDVAEMSFIADIFLYKTWKDYRLIYPANRNIEKVALHPEWRKYLWTPDVYFHNAIEAKVLNTVIPYVFLWLKNDSTLIFGARLSLEFSCDMLLHNFPHDTQTCDMIVKSRFCKRKIEEWGTIVPILALCIILIVTHTLSDMNLHWNEKDSISVGDYIILPQFEFSSPVPATCQEIHQMGKHGKFACLRGVIQLTRRSGYYVINIYIPTILIVFMSMLTFWIPVDAVPGRVTLGVTSLLTIITKQYQASLPSVSYIVALNIWLSVCIGFVFGGLLEYAAVVALLNHQKRIMPNAAKGTSQGSASHGGDCEYLKNAFFARLEKIEVHNIDRVCRIAFPAVFCLHCIIYWIVYAN